MPKEFEEDTGDVTIRQKMVPTEEIAVVEGPSLGSEDDYWIREKATVLPTGFLAVLTRALGIIERNEQFIFQQRLFSLAADQIVTDPHVLGIFGEILTESTIAVRLIDPLRKIFVSQGRDYYQTFNHRLGFLNSPIHELVELERSSDGKHWPDFGSLNGTLHPLQFKIARTLKITHKCVVEPRPHVIDEAELGSMQFGLTLEKIVGQQLFGRFFLKVNGRGLKTTVHYRKFECTVQSRSRTHQKQAMSDMLNQGRVFVTELRNTLLT